MTHLLLLTCHVGFLFTPYTSKAHGITRHTQQNVRYKTERTVQRVPSAAAAAAGGAAAAATRNESTESTCSVLESIVESLDNHISNNDVPDIVEPQPADETNWIQSHPQAGSVDGDNPGASAAAAAAAEWWKGGSEESVGSPAQLSPFSPFTTFEMQGALDKSAATHAMVAQPNTTTSGSGGGAAPTPGSASASFSNNGGKRRPLPWPALPSPRPIGNGQPLPFTAGKYHKGKALLTEIELQRLTALGLELREALGRIQHQLVATLGNSAIWHLSDVGLWDAGPMFIGHDNVSTQIRSPIMEQLVAAQRGPSQALVDFVRDVSSRVFDGIEGEPASDIASYADEDAWQPTLYGAP